MEQNAELRILLHCSPTPKSGANAADKQLRPRRAEIFALPNASARRHFLAIFAPFAAIPASS